MLSLAGSALFPTAPPRMVGLRDSVSQLNHVDLDHGLITSLYNPFAAVPSMHFGYALLIGAVLVGWRALGSRQGWRPPSTRCSACR
jgi:hypothetical protein